TGQPTQIPPVPARKKRRYEGRVVDVAVSPDKTRLALLDIMNDVRVWNIRDGRQVGPAFPCAGRPEQLKFLDDRRCCLIMQKEPSTPGGHDWEMRVEVVDVLSGKLAWPPIVQPGIGQGVRILPGNRHVMLGGAKQQTIWDLATGQQVAVPLANLPLTIG